MVIVGLNNIGSCRAVPKFSVTEFRRRCVNVQPQFRHALPSSKLEARFLPAFGAIP